MSGTQTKVYQAGETPWIYAGPVVRVEGGAIVTALEPGESIAFTVRDSAGSEVATGSTPDDVDYRSLTIDSRTFSAWAAKLEALPPGIYRIRWTLTIGGGTAVEDDRLRVVG